MLGDAGFFNTTIDAPAMKGRGHLSGLDLLVSSTGGDVTLYDGQDANSGRKIGTYKGTANVSNPIRWSPPISIENGIYVDIGSNVTEVTVHFIPERVEE